MATEDEIVSVPLNAGLDLKRDEFTNEPPRLLRSDNVDNEQEIGAANSLPELRDLGPFSSTGFTQRRPQALVPGGDAICAIMDTGDSLVYNKETDTWSGDEVSTPSISADIVGEFIATGQRPISEIAHGGARSATSNFDVYAWLETDEDGLEGATGKFVIRAGGSNVGPFPLPVHDGTGSVQYLSLALTVGETEVYLYITELGEVSKRSVVGYRIEADGTVTESNVIVALSVNNAYAIDVVTDFATDVDRSHLLVVNFQTSVTLFDIVAFGAVTPHAQGVVGTPLFEQAAAIDYVSTLVVMAFCLQSGGVLSLLGSRSNSFGTFTLNTDPGGGLLGARITVRASDNLGFVGALTEHKGINGVPLDDEENMALFDVAPFGGALDVRRNVRNMRLTGDGFLIHHDKIGNPLASLILPMAFTKPNSISPTETQVARATWPVDPAIVGYMVNPVSPTADDTFAMSPVARWGTDRVRTGWGRSKLAMPYAADPTTPDQVFGRSLLSVSIVPRRGSSVAVLANGGALFGTSIAHIFDGHNFMPACHLWRPEIATVGTTFAGTTPAGTYNYKAVFIWEDDTGLLIRSADSTSVEHVAGSNENVSVSVSCHQAPQHDDAVRERIRCWLYATEDGEANYFLLTDANGDPEEGNYSLFGNVFSFTLDNGAGDPTNPILTFATVPPEVAPQAPNGFLDVTAVHNRVWGIDAEDRNRVWFSKRMGRFGAPEFNAILTVDFPEEDGPLTALGNVNGNPVFFKRHSVWVLQGGEGPENVIGFGRNYARPVRVAQSGTNDRRSVLTFPGGIVFHTGRALMLLTTGLQVTPFGMEISPQTLGGFVSATHISGRRELHFQFSGSRHFVYNYDVDLWSEWTSFVFIDSIVSKRSTIFLQDPDPLTETTFVRCIQLKEEESDRSLGDVRSLSTTDIVIKTAFIRPGDRNAARRVREVVVELRRTLNQEAGEGLIRVQVFGEHGASTTNRTFTSDAINTAYPLSGTDRIFLRVIPTEQLESASVEVSIPADAFIGFQPVSVNVSFGIEPGVQRRFPEGITK